MGIIQYFTNLWYRTPSQTEQNATDIARLQYEQKETTKGLQSLASATYELHEEVMATQDMIDELENDGIVSPEVADIIRRLTNVEEKVKVLEYDMSQGKVEDAYQAAEEAQEALAELEIRRAIEGADTEDNILYLEDLIEQPYLFGK
jgi:hypothetical protein